MDLPKWAVPMTEEKSDALRIFLNATLKYVRNVGARYSTQRNEGFHSLKAQMARQDICWGYRWNGLIQSVPKCLLRCLLRLRFHGVRADNTEGIVMVMVTTTNVVG